MVVAGEFGQMDLPHCFSTRQICAQEASPLQGLPTWRYRVLKTALRLRPRRALSSALGQKSMLAQNNSNKNSENLIHTICSRFVDKTHTCFRGFCGFRGRN